MAKKIMASAIKITNPSQGLVPRKPPTKNEIIASAMHMRQRIANTQPIALLETSPRKLISSSCQIAKYNNNNCYYYIMSINENRGEPI
jgi:hypothetical protein